jgi:ribosome-associated translation inhibitor RaiA
MRIHIREHHGEAPEALRAYAEQRLRDALGRYEPYILEVTVLLTGASSPGARVGKHCRIVVAMTNAGHVSATAFDTEAPAAIDRASDQVVHAVARDLEWASIPSVRVPMTTRIPAASLFRKVARAPYETETAPRSDHLR